MAVDVRSPHALELRPGRCPNPTCARSCLGVSGCGTVFRMFGVHGALAVLRRGVLHGGGSFGVVQWAPLLTSANVWLELGDR